jgi:hypothetical protein
VSPPVRLVLGRSLLLALGAAPGAAFASLGACSNYHTVAVGPDSGGSSSGGDSGPRDAGPAHDSGGDSGGDSGDDSGGSEGGVDSGCPFPLHDAGAPYVIGPDGGEDITCEQCIVEECGPQYACCQSDPNTVPSDDGGLQSGCLSFVFCTWDDAGDTAFCSAGLSAISTGTGVGVTQCSEFSVCTCP